MRNAWTRIRAGIVLCALLGWVTTAVAQEEVAPGLKVGDTLDQSNWQGAKDLLPAEILKHYETGEYKIPS